MRSCGRAIVSIYSSVNAIFILSIDLSGGDWELLWVQIALENLHF